MHIPHLRLTAAVAAVVLALDQATKLAVIDWLAPGTGWPAPDAGIGRYLRIVHVHNTGVAFGMFQGRNALFAVLATAVVTGLVAYTARLPGDGRALRVAVGLVAGGAVGNLIDRVVHGYVVDFIHAHWGAAYFPAFNVADSAITVGAASLLLDELLRVRRGR